MYWLSRYFLILGIVEICICCILLVLAFLPWSLFVLACLIAKARAPAMQYTAFGTARWATEDDLRDAGMMGASQGLAIGSLYEFSRPGYLSTIVDLWDRRISSKDISERVLSQFAGRKPVSRPRKKVRLARSVHSVIFGPTGAGKGSSFIIPWLLETDQSAVVLDYKGENAAITASRREQQFGHRVVLLDPFHVVTKSPDTYNPIDDLKKDSPFKIDESRDLASQLVVRTGEEREPFWNDAAEAWISAAILAVVLHAAPENRSLQTVRDVLSDPARLTGLIELLASSGPIEARIGLQLNHFRDRELSSTLTSANRHLNFLDTESIHASTSSSSFDPRELRKGKMTIYCILPPQHMQSQSALIRMWIGSFMKSIISQGLTYGR